MASIRSDGQRVSATTSSSNRVGTALRLLVGVGALALYYFGKFDLRALEPLVRSPWTILGETMHIGNISLLDISIAAPLALVANVLPFTPGGLGIGEAAFDQICRWLVPSPTSAP
jgi:hypothetical protein